MNIFLRATIEIMLYILLVVVLCVTAYTITLDFDGKFFGVIYQNLIFQNLPIPFFVFPITFGIIMRQYFRKHFLIGFVIVWFGTTYYDFKFGAPNIVKKFNPDSVEQSKTMFGELMNTLATILNPEISSIDTHIQRFIERIYEQGIIWVIPCLVLSIIVIIFTKYILKPT